MSDYISPRTPHDQIMVEEGGRCRWQGDCHWCAEDKLVAEAIKCPACGAPVIEESPGGRLRWDLPSGLWWVTHSNPDSESWLRRFLRWPKHHGDGGMP